MFRSRYFRLFLGIALLGAILSQIPLAELGDSIAAIQIAPFFCGVVAIFIARVIAARRMYLYLKRQNCVISLLTVLALNLKSTYYSFFLPGQIAGGAVRWYLYKRYGVPGMSALAGIVYERLHDTIGVLFLGFVASWVVEIPFISSAVRMVFGGTLLAMLIIEIISGHKDLFNSATRFFTKWEKGSKSILIGKIAQRMSELNYLINEYSVALRIRLGIISIVSQSFGVISFYFVALSVGVELGILELVWIHCAVAIISLFPITFAGIGVREGVLISFLGLYGVSTVESVTISLALLLRIIIVTLVGGLLILADLLSGNSAFSGSNRCTRKA